MGKGVCGLMYRRHAREARETAVGWDGVEVEAVGRMFSPTVVWFNHFLFLSSNVCLTQRQEAYIRFGYHLWLVVPSSLCLCDGARGWGCDRRIAIPCTFHL